MADGAQAAEIRRNAQAALDMKNRWDRKTIMPTAQELAQNITVFPAGRVLPASFLAQDWGSTARWTLPSCLEQAEHKCDAVLIDIDGDGREEVVFLDPPMRLIVMAEDAQGAWSRIGQFEGPVHCQAIRDALRAGEFRLDRQKWRDLEVAQLRLRFAQSVDVGKCP